MGDRVRARREELGLSQVELAEQMGTTQPRLSQIEHGAIEQLSVSMLFRLAETLESELTIDFVQRP